MTSYAVLSDLHANATALAASLEQTRALSPDRVIILGDLLTYGMDVRETLDIVESLAAGGATVILGNHDKLYLDLAAGGQVHGEPVLTDLDVAGGGRRDDRQDEADAEQAASEHGYL